MPKYLVERSIPRAGELTAQELKAIAQQSLRVQQEMEAEILWIHSTITANRMVCLFIAANEAIVENMHGAVVCQFNESQRCRL